MSSYNLNVYVDKITTLADECFCCRLVKLKDYFFCGVLCCAVVWRVVACYGVAWRGVLWCGVAWCGVLWCGVAWRGVLWRVMVWRGVAWRGVAWRGVARQSAAPPPAAVLWKRTLIDLMVLCGRSRLVSSLAAQRGRHAADLLPH